MNIKNLSILEKFRETSNFLKSIIKSLIVLSFFLLNACSSNYYSCVDKKSGHKELFSWSYVKGIELNHISFPPVPPVALFSTQYSETLSANQKGGSYNITITNNYAKVNYIQDTVLSFLQIPNGKLVPEGNSPFEKLYKREYKTLVRFHTVFPSLETAQLDFETKVLTRTSRYLEKARKATKIKFDTNKRNKSGRVYPVEKKPMSEKELKQHFSDFLNQKRHKTIYQCEQINPIKGGLIHWIKVLLFP